MGPNNSAAAMPSVSASVVCEPPATITSEASAAHSCNAAIRDSLALSATVDLALRSDAKWKNLQSLQKVEYEPAPADFHNNVAETLKSKYTVLTANGPNGLNGNATPAKNGMGATRKCRPVRYDIGNSVVCSRCLCAGA